MKCKLALTVLWLASLAQAQEPRKYHTGQLLQMESLQCTVFENPSSNAKATDAASCQEYVVQGDEVLFHLRARDTKRTVLLPVGKEVGYRIDEGKFFLLTAGEKKEHQYIVVSMEARTNPQATIESATKVNHLQ